MTTAFGFKLVHLSHLSVSVFLHLNLSAKSLLISSWLLTQISGMLYYHLLGLADNGFNQLWKKNSELNSNQKLPCIITVIGRWKFTFGCWVYVYLFQWASVLADSNRVFCYWPYPCCTYWFYCYFTTCLGSIAQLSFAHSYLPLISENCYSLLPFFFFFKL